MAASRMIMNEIGDHHRLFQTFPDIMKNRFQYIVKILGSNNRWRNLGILQ